MKEVLEKDELIFEAALHILDRRMRTEKELRDKLKERLSSPLEKGEISEDDLDICVARLKEDRLLDDMRYALEYIYLSEQRGRGEKRIRLELQRKGIERYTVEDAFYEHGKALLEEEGLDSREAERRRALELAERTLSAAKKSPASDPKKLEQKLIRKLQTQGYTPDIIFPVVKEALSSL